MLNFPHYQFLISGALSFVTLGSLGFFFSVKAFLNRKDKEKFFGHIVSCVIFFLFLIVGSFFGSLDFYHTYKFRNIDISNVSSFKVYQSEKEDTINDKKSVEINDKSIIERMLRSLQKCQVFSPNHESFVDGYKINLVFTDEKYDNDLYISVYRNSTQNNGKTSVMPHKTIGRGVSLGDYNCPEFQKLVQENIDPLFKY